MKITILVLTLAATAGAFLRWTLSLSINNRYNYPEWLRTAFAVDSATIPLGTLTANVLGSVILGWAYYSSQGMLADKTSPAYFALAVGFCGSLTTFSTLCLELVTLTEKGQLWFALIYVVASLGLGIFGILFGKFMAV